MAKTQQGYSENSAENLQVITTDGTPIPLGEGQMLPKHVNDAVRSIMADTAVAAKLAGTPANRTPSLTVKVVADATATGSMPAVGGSKLEIDGAVNPVILFSGATDAAFTYTFDTSDSSVTGALRFYADAGQVTEITAGVTITGTAGTAGSQTVIAPTEATPRVLYYQIGGSTGLGGVAYVLGADDASAEAAAAAASATAAAGSATAAGQSEANAAASSSAANEAKVAAVAAKDGAASSETAASTSATNAAASQASATTSASAAATSAANAATSATAAATSETNAAASETAAATSETNAGTSATAAATSATSASTSATNAATSETNAAGSATAAATSATNAATSEANAATSETNAAGSATAAATSATNAATSETNAATSETNAAASETAAATSETNAATSETNAAGSATAAATSAANAATSETNAAGSATAAATSETNAATSASNAATSETNAATSASNASSSQTAAASSATAAATSASSASSSATLAAAAAANIDLSSIAATKTGTAVDVFVYDTRNDSDGGAWRHRTQHTSWYAEASSANRDPNTRSTRAEFPAVAVIVAEANKVTIYDGDDPSLPMWMVFNGESTGTRMVRNNETVAVYFRDGLLAVAFNGTLYGGISLISFVSDAHTLHGSSQIFTLNQTLVQRNTNGSFVGLGGSGLVNANVNDVAMTVLPDAPTDPATGLPVPTIAVGTAGGVSVIRDDGTVVDNNNAVYASSVSFSQNGDYLVTGRSTQATNQFAVSSSNDYVVDGFDAESVGFYAFTTTPALLPPKSGSKGYAIVAGDVLCSWNDNGDGLALIAQDPITKANGMVAYTTSSYATGWMNGDIKLAALANSATADRSVNNNPLTQYGTITAAPVATGADVMAYSGFSASNYLEQPYNPDLDFGTGDFSVMFWFKGTDYYGMFVTTDVTGQVKGFYCAVTGLTDESNYEFMIGNGTEYTTYSSSISTNIDADVWTHVAFVVEDGDVKIYENGSLFYGPTATTRSVAGGGPLTIGYRPWDNAQNYSGSLALLRISGTAPTADQIKKIYEDEKVLFQPNAKATLTGSSDAVTALAHDPDTNLLHVGTPGGRSVFQGLRRVEEHTGTNSQSLAAISAVDGLVVEGK